MYIIFIQWDEDEYNSICIYGYAFTSILGNKLLSLCANHWYVYVCAQIIYICNYVQTSIARKLSI